ncbi:MAG: hypothetical protein ISS19_09600 [Bacteroidales bacterium]|nr:hypothetical protein [Bacteroidales bacterium]
MINIESTIYLKIVSPIHIGGAQEKHLQEGLDYFENWRINEKEVFHPERGLDPDELADAFASGSKNALGNLIKKQKDWMRFVTDFDGPRGSTGDIKAFIKSGADGLAYIPGSSIKGALRSAVAHYLCGGTSRNNPDKEFIKDFDESAFRFVKVSDSQFINVRLFRSKIASLGGANEQFKIRWKERRNQNADRFTPNGFDTSFESPHLNSEVTFQLRIGQPVLKIFGRQLSDMNADSREFLLKDDIINSFLSAVNSCSSDYLERELAWHTQYKGDQTDRIIMEFKRLQKRSRTEGFYLLHMGAGSGFHAMTGDWIYQDHTKTGFWNNGKPKYKTRRIAFDNWPNSGYFGPMGFVLLSLTPFPKDQHRDDPTENGKEPDIPQVEEIKPIHRKVTIKSGVYLDGVVKDNNMVDVYMPDGSIKTVKLVSGSADSGSIIEVQIYPDGKGKFHQASFRGYRKQ